MDKIVALDFSLPIVITIEDGISGYRFTIPEMVVKKITEWEPTPPTMIYHSQRDPHWRDQPYADTITFGAAGCYVCCVAMMLSLAGYTDDPPTVAAKLYDARCFSGDLLTYPERIPNAYPRMRYDGTHRWHDQPADMNVVNAALMKGPVIAELDFHPGGPFNQHFVIIEQYTTRHDDMLIVDPWDGAPTRMLERYALNHWVLSRAIYGLRLLRVDQE